MGPLAIRWAASVRGGDLSEGRISAETPWRKLVHRIPPREWSRCMTLSSAPGSTSISSSTATTPRARVPRIRTPEGKGHLRTPLLMTAWINMTKQIRQALLIVRCGLKSSRRVFRIQAVAWVLSVVCIRNNNLDPKLPFVKPS